MKAFAPTDDVPLPPGSGALPALHVPPVTALRRYRQPVPARVVVEHDAPVRVTTDRRGLPGGRVTQASGPWRTSGGWWEDVPAAAPAAGAPSVSGPSAPLSAARPSLAPPAVLPAMLPSAAPSATPPSATPLSAAPSSAARPSVAPPARPAPHTAASAVSWDRDEWDVTLGDGATYRLFRHRGADAWFVDGVVD